MKNRKLTCFALAFLLVLPLLAACGRGTSDPTPLDDPSSQTHDETEAARTFIPLETLTNRVLTNGYTVDCGSLLITSRWNTAYRYNLLTGTFHKACADPECGGSCPLEGKICVPLQVVDGKLYYFTKMSKSLGDVNNPFPRVYGYQDLKTGEIKILVELSYAENGGARIGFVYDGMLYYMRNGFDPGIDADDPDSALDTDNYKRCIYRVPTDGGREESVKAIPDEYLWLAADGYFLTLSADKTVVYSYDKDFKEQTVLADLNERELGITSSMQYTDGKAYFIARTRGDAETAYLYSLDLAHGTLSLLVGKRISHFQLTEDAIFYTLREERIIYEPDGWNGMTEEEKDESKYKPTYAYSSAELYACDLDGQNERVVFRDERRDYTEDFTVIDGVLYGWIQDFDDTTLRWGDRYFGSIDFAAGKVTKIRPRTES